MNLFALIVTIFSDVTDVFSEIYKRLNVFFSIANNCIVTLRTPCI